MPDDELRLFHFTSRIQLPSILTMGELLMTPDPYAPPVDGEPWPVLWLSSVSGDGLTADSVRAGLGLDGAVKMGALGAFVAQDKTEIRIEVVPDLSQMMPVEHWAKATGYSAKSLRHIDAWPSRASWWWISQAQIPQDRWIEISVRNDEGVWVPMFEAPTVVEPEEAPAPEADEKPSETQRLRNYLKRFIRA